MGRLWLAVRHPWVTYRGWRLWAKIVVPLVVLFAIIGAASSGSSKPSSNAPPPAAAASATTTPTPTTTAAPPKPTIPKAEKDARSWITAHGADSNRVQANILIVQIDVLALQKSPTQANLNKVAIDAQTAHDNIDTIRADFAGGYGSDTLGTAELNAFSGANDLKNSMGALVAYAGTPNAATLAHFNAQYSQARAEWNQGVRIIWRLAKRKSPPTI